MADKVMSQFDVEDTLAYFNSLTDEKRKLVIGQITDQELWEELYARHMRHLHKVENMEKALRA